MDTRVFLPQSHVRSTEEKAVANAVFERSELECQPSHRHEVPDEYSAPHPVQYQLCVPIPGKQSDKS